MRILKVSDLKKWVFLGLLLSLNWLHAGFYMQLSSNYHSETDAGDAQPLTFTKMNNALFLGASLDSNKKFILGQHAASWTKTVTKGEDDTATTYTFTELGPRFHWYFTQERKLYIAFAYNPFCKGTATVTEVDSEMSGTSTVGSLGYHIKTSKRTAVGASITYHAATITQVIIEEEETEVTNTYTSIGPYFEFIARW